MKRNKRMLKLLAGSMIPGVCGTILHAEETEEQFCMITEDSGSDLTKQIWQSLQKMNRRSCWLSSMTGRKA